MPLSPCLDRNDLLRSKYELKLATGLNDTIAEVVWFTSFSDGSEDGII